MRTSISFLVLFAAGCGKVHLPGSSGLDGGGDGGADGAGPGPVSVTVLSFDGLRTPLEGVPVGFFDPDGAHRATVDTDGDGIATGEALPGGAVVAFMSLPGSEASRVARAVLAIDPGDEILIAGEPFPSGDPVATMTVALPAVAGATFYQLGTSCGSFSSAGPSITISFRPSCDVDTVSFLAATADDAGGRHYLGEEEVPVVDGGTYNAMASWQMMPTRPFLFTGVPDEADTIEAGVVGLRAGGHHIDIPLQRDFAPAVEEMLTLRPERIPGYEGTLMWSQVQAEQPVLGAFTLYRWLGPDDDTDADLAELMLPWMGLLTYQAATRTLSWPLVGEQEFDATYLNLIASRNDPEKGLHEILWFVVAPPGIQSVTLPEVPDELSDYFLPEPQNVFAYGDLVESNQVDGYPAARRLGFDPSYLPELEPVGTVVRNSASGTAFEK